ncbi:hypothetical protein ACOPJQ_05485 [Luteimonas dalianensis]|uniref:hypothetical protein n=1 Tax=Luteimonas dalianensis TaxID=1148196 RepID=UPI003BF44782
MFFIPLLISGYIFNLIFYPFRYFSGRAEGQKLFFMASGSGLILGAMSFILSGAIAGTSWFQGSWLLSAALEIDRSIPVPHACRLLATIFGSVILAYALNSLLWMRYGRNGRPTAKRIYNKLTDAFGNPLSQLLRKAADSQRLVMLTLKSRKVYCGRILEVPPDIESDDACVELLPSFSAYREKETLLIGEKKTEYPVISLWEAKQYVFSSREALKMLEERLDQFPAELRDSITREQERIRSDIKGAEEVISEFGEPPRFDPLDWVKVIPIKEVESASLYDPEAYDTWFAGSRGHPQKTASIET